MSASMSYDDLMAIVYAVPALTPTGLAKSVVITFLVLIVINSIVVGLRIYVRSVLNRGSFGADDILAITGYICYLVATVYGIKGCYYGIATPDSKLPSQMYMIRGAQLLLWWQIPYVISIPLIKSAIAMQILRLTSALKFRIPLWFVIGGSTFNALAGLIAALVHCKPISASWTGMGTCGSNKPLLNFSYLFTAIAIVADFTCAIVPFFLIHNLNMNTRKKHSLIAILSVGVAAGIFTIVRVPYFKHYLITADALYYQGWIMLWSMLEEGVGMFAASLPSLRKLFVEYYGSTNDSKGTTGRTGPSGSRTIGDTPMGTLQPTGRRGDFKTSVVGGKWEHMDDDDSSRRGIITQHEINIEAHDADSHHSK